EAPAPQEAPPAPPPAPAGEALLSWDLEQTMSDRGTSTCAAISSAPRTINGFLSQTGGRPAEAWDQEGTVFLTRHPGTQACLPWVSVSRPVLLEGLTFRHWHNHNPGFPTCPGYRVQLQIDAGQGYADLGPALALSNVNSGHTDTIALQHRLEPGN